MVGIAHFFDLPGSSSGPISLHLSGVLSGVEVIVVSVLVTTWVVLLQVLPSKFSHVAI